jgi:hypothetical protein
MNAFYVEGGIVQETICPQRFAPGLQCVRRRGRGVHSPRARDLDQTIRCFFLLLSSSIPSLLYKSQVWKGRDFLARLGQHGPYNNSM